MARTARSSRVGPTLATTTPSISNFARVSKAPLGQEGLAAKKLVGEDYVATSGSRKRKVAVEDGLDASKRACVRGDEDAKENQKNAAKPGLFQDATKLKAQPDKKKNGSAEKTHRADTKDRVTKSSKRKKAQKSSSGRIDEYFQRVQDNAETKDAPKLPPHLAELVSLHEAFLKIITLQFVHNGTAVPVDVRSLCTNISRTWGKRTVTTDDIRTCIAVEGLKPEAPSPFIVSSYGFGKVCVEPNPDVGAPSVQQDKLCVQFEDNLRALCTERATNEMTDLDIPLANLSLAELPMAPITLRGASAGVNPMLAKGHHALAELKSSIAAKQQEKQHRLASNAAMTNPDGSKMSLLDRVRAKAAAKSQLPLALTGPELQRRAALQRVPDVAATISMLSLADPMPRLAFSMTALVQRLRDSLAMPVSSEEAAMCVRLLAGEVAPGWIQVVTIGGKENVVVQRAGQPVDRVIRDRVAELLSA
ncbi:hypothetical protein VUR80DRAFT_4324 [Thermomyces stellatus]